MNDQVVVHKKDELRQALEGIHMVQTIGLADWLYRKRLTTIAKELEKSGYFLNIDEANEAAKAANFKYALDMIKADLKTENRDMGSNANA